MFADIKGCLSFILMLDHNKPCFKAHAHNQRNLIVFSDFNICIWYIYAYIKDIQVCLEWSLTLPLLKN